MRRLSALLALVLVPAAAAAQTPVTPTSSAPPAGPINRLLGAVFAFERYWAARRSVPIGVSLAVVADRA